MGTIKKRKLRIDRVFLAVLILIIIIFIMSKALFINKKPEKILMTNLIGSNITSVLSNIEKYNFDLTIQYKYDDIVEKDMIISQSIDKDAEINNGDKLNIVVSLGKIDKEKLKKDGINELGKVPIMMYHGIKNMKNSETNYILGNVDKDGYTRTVEAFRNDLDFYYKSGYRMVRLTDYINGNIDVDYGYSPIILTFDDGNENNIKVTGLDASGNIIIDKNSAVGVLEEYKKKYPDYNVTAIFFVTDALFNQPLYNEKILKWLVNNGYEVGNHTKGHNDLRETTQMKTQEVIGYMYNKLESILDDKYSKILALPFGSPYVKTHANYQYVVSGEYDGKKYESLGALRVGWEPEVSPFNKDFDATFLKRCRAYDNNGVDFDIEMVFKMLTKNRYISDGNIDTIVTDSKNKVYINNKLDKEVILYE